jgi:DNA-binding LacI/PurR family transcriptional regulator/signal transduction histidine kinase
MQKINPTGKQNKRPTIGFLIDWLGGRYQSLLWPGIADLAEERDVNLIIFSGGSLYSPHGYLDERNALYDLVSRENVDGLVIASGALSDYITSDEFEKFYTCFHPLPMVSIAKSLENIPSMLVDNEEGIRCLVDHLVEMHGCRHIAFIRGSEGHEEAEQRFAAYKDALAEHGIPFDPDLTAPGEFTMESGVQAVGLFLDQRKVRFEAIVAVDDDTALGAINELQARGVRVPGDIAVTGFDDIDEAQFASPSLTTIRQPIYEQARKSVELLLDLLDCKDAPNRVQLPTELIVRQSCGCLTESVKQAGEFAAAGSIHELPLAEKRKRSLAQISNALEMNLVNFKDKLLFSTWAEQLLDSFLVDLGSNTNYQFLTTLDGLLQRTKDIKNFSSWQNVISVVRHNILFYFPELTASQKAESIFGQARVIIAEIMERVQASQVLQSQQRSLIVDEGGQSLLATLEMDVLMNVAKETMQNLGIKGGYIALYDGKDSSSGKSNLILAFDETGISRIREGERSYPSCQLLPPYLMPGERRFTWNIEALYFQREQLGFAIFEIGPRDGALYAALRRQLSSALKGALLLQERKQAEEALKNAFKELESFSYSVSHDLRAPLRAIRGYSDMLQKDFGDRLDPDAKSLLDKVSNAALDMNAKIDGLLTFSRLSRSELKRTTLNLSEMAESVIDILRDGDHTRNVIVEIMPGVTAEADMTLMRNVIENLIGNAWKYTSKTPDAHIAFGMQVQNGKTVYYVRDNGAGFDMKYSDKLFGAFQRMHRSDEFEGQGIGLATVKRIIRRHGGEIWFEAALDKGATFYFTLVLELP